MYCNVTSCSDSFSLLLLLLFSYIFHLHLFFFFFFFNDTATTEIYTLSLHDALPIFQVRREQSRVASEHPNWGAVQFRQDRKSTRLNSSHDQISYAVFCLKKKKKNTKML